MPNISEKALVSFLPSVAWTLLCASNAPIPEWVSDDQGYRMSAFLELLLKQDARAIAWLTEVAKGLGEDGQPWLDLVEALEKYRWDETAWRLERIEAILTLVIYCKDHPGDESAQKHLAGELRYWEDRYGELGFKTFEEWRNHWEYWIGTIDNYEHEKLLEDSTED